jgi:hypothetical protein
LPHHRCGGIQGWSPFCLSTAARIVKIAGATTPGHH